MCGSKFILRKIVTLGIMRQINLYNIVLVPMKKILVAGGNGYIGSHTAIHLIESGYFVYILDKQMPNFMFEKYIKTVPDQVQQVNFDFTDKPQLKEFLESSQIDGVIQFAADPAIVSQKPEDVSRYFTSNLISSINLIDLCRELGIKNFVFSSTAATYGNPERVPISEEDRKLPINTYGRTKLVVEQMLDDYADIYNMPSICLRYFNACGADKDLRTAEFRPKETHIIPLLVQKVIAGEKFSIFGDDYNTDDGTCVRDYVHVKDLARAHLKALEAMIEGRVHHDHINLGSDLGFSNKQIVDMVRQVSGIDFEVEIGPRREGDPDKLIANNAHAQEVLNWKPEFELEEIVQSVWDAENYKVKNR